MLIGTGIVDDNIERSMLRHDLLHHGSVRDIDMRRVRTDLPGQIGSTGDVEIADDDFGAGGSKGPHDRRPDALCATGNEGAATVEPSERQGAVARHRSESPECRLAPFDHRGEALAGVGGAGEFGYR